MSGKGILRTQSAVAFAISSPTFFGDRPRGPILGARAEEAPTSPPVARRWLWTASLLAPILSSHRRVAARKRVISSQRVRIVGAAGAAGSGVFRRNSLHDLDLIGVKLRGCTILRISIP